MAGVNGDNQVGAMLRAARDGKGITLAKAEAGTRIRQKYLQALEEGRADELPEPVFVKGFLRNYAIFLGLNPTEVVKLYESEYGTKKPDIPDVEPELEPIRTPSHLTPAMLTMALAVVVFLLVMYYLYQQYAAPPPPPTPTIVLDLPTATPVPTVAATRVPTPSQLDVVVPDLLGMTLQEADTALRNLRLTVEVVDRQFSNNVPAGVVISQTVKAQTKVREGSVVGVTLSRGTQMVSVPRLVGLSYIDAVARVNAAGLRAQRIEVSAQGAPNTVVGQDPIENAQVAPNSIVKLTVSVGDVVTVPDVRGLRLEEGKDVLLKAGLVIGQVSLQGKDRVPLSDLLKVCQGCILSSDPPAGRIVPRGTVINIGVRAE